MILPGADLCVGEIRRRACRLPHFDRRSLLDGCPVAELTIVVPSPGVGVAVAAQGQRMPTSGADLHIGEIRGCAFRLAHLDRCSPLSGCPVAELAMPVVSPCVGVPVAAHSQGKTIGSPTVV